MTHELDTEHSAYALPSVRNILDENIVPTGGEMKLPLENGNYRKPLEVIARVLLFSALGVWLFHLYIYYQYDSTRPLQPDRFSGAIYAQSNQGHTVYLTRAEDATLTKLTIFAVALAITGFLISHLFVERIGWSKRGEPKPWETKKW
jgi:hypothetical protein